MKIKSEDKIKLVICSLIVLTLLFVNISLVSSAECGSIGTFKQDSTLELIQICDTCTYVNVSSVQYPNGTIININKAMTKNGITYNYTFSSTNQLGTYLYNVVGDKNTISVEDLCFTITYNGEEFSTSKSILYSILLIFVIGIFVLSLYITTRLPYYNPRDEDGVLVGVSSFKYTKVGLIVLSYCIFVLVLFMIANVSIAFLGNLLIGKFFFTLYQIFFKFMFLLILVSFIWLIVLLVKDNKIKESLSRGLEVR